MMLQNIILRTLGAAICFALAGNVFPASAQAAETYKIDPVHSFLLFKIEHLGVGNAYGFFEKFEGTITFDEENPSASSVNLTVQTASVDTNNADRDKHLVGTDFFNATEFPTATFQSTQVEKTGEGTWAITGDLTLLGQTKPVTFNFQEIGKGKGMQGETRRGGEGTLTFKRTDFGMDKYVEEGVLGDETTLILAVEGVLEEE